MDRLTKNFFAKPSGIKYQVLSISAHALGIKCVQPVNLLRTKMCTTVSSAHAVLLRISTVCTNSVHSPIVQQFVHRLFWPNPIWATPALYTVSTEPTITTILINNKRQEEPIKENS